MWIEKQEPKNLDKTLEDILRNSSFWGIETNQRKWMKQSLAALDGFLPNTDSKKNISSEDIKTAISGSIESKWKFPDTATNKKQLDSLKQEFLSHIWTITDKAELLKAYGEFSGMIEWQIGAANGAGETYSKDFQRAQQKAEQNDKQSRDFVKLWQEFRDELQKAQEATRLAQNKAVQAAQNNTLKDSTQSQEAALSWLAESAPYFG
jgi:hypothetical protein